MKIRGGHYSMKRISIQSMLIVSFLSIIVSCQQQKGNYESDGPFIVVTDYIGGEIHVLDSFPSIYAIELSGKLRLYSEIEANHKLTFDDDAPTYELDLSKEEIEYLKSLIEKNNFWKLDEHLPDDGALDSGSHYVTVHLTDESKTVGGYSPADPAFREISSYVSNLVDYDDYKKWREEMKEHISSLNPDF